MSVGRFSDQAERAVGHVVAEQHHRPREVRVLQLRHRHAAASAETGSSSSAITSAPVLAIEPRPSAQPRVPRPAGRGRSARRAPRAACGRACAAAVANRHRQVAPQPRTPARFIALPFSSARSSSSDRCHKSSSAGRRGRRAAATPASAGHAVDGVLVPGTDVLADVAAVGVMRRCLAALLRESLPLVSIVRYDRHRVASSTCGSTSAPVGHASRQQRAGPALIERRLVGLELQIGDDHGQEQPGPELGVDQARVLADPAEPGVLRVDALLHRTGVDVARAPRSRPPPRARSRLDQRVQPALDDDVIVVAPGVARDRRAIAARRTRSSRAGRCCRSCRGDDRARRGQDVPDVARGARPIAAGSASRRRSRGRATRGGTASSTWFAAGAMPHRSKPAAAASRLTSADEIEAAIMQVLRPPAIAACYCRSS